MAPVLNFKWGPSLPSSGFLRFYSDGTNQTAVTKDVQINFIQCSDAISGSDSATFTHVKPQYEDEETNDFTGIFNSYVVTYPICQGTDIVLSSTNAWAYTQASTSLAELSGTTVTFHTTNTNGTYTLYVLYRATKANTQFWAKPINYTIYTNCSLETFTPVVNPIVHYLQKNDVAGLVKILQSDINLYWNSARKNPLCVISDWELMPISSLTTLTSVDDVWVRTGQATRSNPMMQLQFNQSLSSVGEIVFDFRMIVFLRADKSNPRNVPHQQLQTFKITLGCYLVNQINIAEPSDLIYSRLLWDSSLRKVTLAYAVSQVSVLTQISLWDLLNVTTNYQYCGPNQVEIFNSSARTTVATNINSNTYLVGMKLANKQYGFMNSFLEFKYGPGLPPQNAYLRFYTDATATTIVTRDAEIAIILCDIPQFTNSSLSVFSKTRFEQDDQIDFRDILVAYIPSNSLCAGPTDLKISLTDTYSETAVPSSVATISGTVMTLKTSESIGEHNFYLIYRATTGKVSITKPIRYIIYPNCSQQEFGPKIKNAVYYVQKQNPRKGFNKTLFQAQPIILESDVSNFFEPQNNPLCVISDWELISTTALTPLTSADEVYNRTGQPSRTYAMAELQFDPTMPALGIQVFNFRLRVYLRADRTSARTVLHPKLATIQVNLGCYRLSKLDIVHVPKPFASNSDLIFERYDEEKKEFIVQIAEPTNSSATVTGKFSFVDFVTFDTGDAFCQYHTLGVYKDANLTQLANSKLDPFYKETSNPILATGNSIGDTDIFYNYKFTSAFQPYRLYFKAETDGSFDSQYYLTTTFSVLFWYDNNITAPVFESDPVLKHTFTYEIDFNQTYKIKKPDYVYTFPPLVHPRKKKVKVYFEFKQAKFATFSFNDQTNEIIMQLQSNSFQSFNSEKEEFTGQIVVGDEQVWNQNTYDVVITLECSRTGNFPCIGQGQIHSNNKSKSFENSKSNKSNAVNYTNNYEFVSPFIVKPVENSQVKEADKIALTKYINASKFVPPKPSQAVKEQEIKEPRPVKIKIQSISKNGHVNIGFNQKLKVPAFIDSKANQSDNSNRFLIPVQSIDMTKIMKVEIRLKQDFGLAKVNYSVQLLEWNPENLKVKIDFDDPTLVSNGISPDEIFISIVEPQLFASEATGEPLSTNETTLSKEIPRMLPEWVEEEQVQKQAKIASYAIFGVTIIAFLVQRQQKAYLTYRLWTMYFTIQMLVYLSVFGVAFPPNAQIYMEEFKNALEFQYFNIDTYMKIKTGNPEFSWLKPSLPFENKKEGTRDLAVDLSVFIFWSVAIFTVILLCFVITKSKIKNQKVKDFGKKVWDFSWRSLAIRWLTVIYMTVAFACANQLIASYKGELNLTGSNKSFTEFAIVFLVFYIGFSFYIIIKNRNEVDKEKMDFELGNLLIEIRLIDIKTGKPILSNLAFFSVFLIRRFLFVFIPTFLSDKYVLALQLIIFMQTLYLIYYLNSSPHISRARVRLEVFNEVMIMLCLYHLICFSEFNLDVSRQFYAGYSFVICFLLVVAVNIGIMLIQNIKCSPRKQSQKTETDEKTEKINEQVEKLGEGKQVKPQLTPSALQIVLDDQPSAQNQTNLTNFNVAAGIIIGGEIAAQLVRKPSQTSKDRKGLGDSMSKKAKSQKGADFLEDFKRGSSMKKENEHDSFDDLLHFQSTRVGEKDEKKDKKHKKDKKEKQEKKEKKSLKEKKEKKKKSKSESKDSEGEPEMSEKTKLSKTPKMSKKKAYNYQAEKDLTLVIEQDYEDEEEAQPQVSRIPSKK